MISGMIVGGLVLIGVFVYADYKQDKQHKQDEEGS